MKILETKIKRVLVGKIEPDEDLIDSILKLVKQYNVYSGFIKCIGALKIFTIGFYRIDSKEYDMKTFNENVELISCIGNIAYMEGEPIIHLHVSLGRSDYSIIGGHLSRPSIISITGETIIFEFDKKINRVNDPIYNLNLLEL
ncbi:MAG: PPC domain-containing DNA-binding protein [Promethearchaeota archaeon]